MRLRITYFLVTVFFLIGIISCNGNNHKVDISSIQSNVTIDRMDIDLFDALRLSKSHWKYKEDYGQLYEFYLYQTLLLSRDIDSMAIASIESFRGDPIMADLNKELRLQYKELGWLRQKIDKMLRYLNYHYPESIEPKIVTMQSAFNFGVVSIDSTIAIGLDMYLGPENKFVKQLSEENIPSHVKSLMKKEFMIADIAESWFSLHHIIENTGLTFADQLIHHGKLMYALDAILPDEEDRIKIRFPEKDLQWCIDHELMIWETIVRDRLLFESDEHLINSFFIKAPFTSRISQESPGRVGTWLGWQIVRDYMEEHSDLSLKDLIQEENTQKILKSYNPK